jgi:hypothetical protein
MENLNAAPAVEQSEPLHGAPVSQAEPAAATSVAPVASTDENAQAEAAELSQSAGAEAADQGCDIEDCSLAEAGHRIVNEAVQEISDRAERTVASVLREDAPDNGDPHEHELERMVDEGGPCPEKPRVVFSKELLKTAQANMPIASRKWANHPFQSSPTPADPCAENCSVEGCQLSELAHPDGKIIPLPADEGDTPNFEERLVALEKGLAELRKITEHHGLRGPQA